MIPDMAAIIIAMTEVTMAIPPRVRDIQTLMASYISLAMLLRSNNIAMKMNRGTANKACSMVRSYIRCPRM